MSYKQVHEAPVAPTEVNSRVPAALSQIIMRCLSKQPSDRYARGNDLADALLEFLAGAAGSHDAYRTAATARRGSRTSPTR